MRQLVLKKQAIQDERQVRKEQDDILVGYAGSFKHEHALINIRPSEASAFLEDFGERRRACLAAIRDLDEQISDVERLIQSEREQKGVQKSGQMSSKVVAVILAKENCAVHLKLTYRQFCANLRLSVILMCLTLPTHSCQRGQLAAIL